MPHIAITMIPGRDEATKRTLAQKAQEFMVKELGVEPKFVSVSIQDVPLCQTRCIRNGGILK